MRINNWVKESHLFRKRSQLPEDGNAKIGFHDYAKDADRADERRERGIRTIETVVTPAEFYIYIQRDDDRVAIAQFTESELERLESAIVDYRRMQKARMAERNAYEAQRSVK